MKSEQGGNAFNLDYLYGYIPITVVARSNFA
jgi:hypothetical protein